MKKTFLIALPLALALGLPAGAQNVTITGANGASAQVNRDCLRGGGTANCTTTTTATGANGQSATKQRNRVTTQGSSATTVTRTGPEGNTSTRKRLITVTR